MAVLSERNGVPESSSFSRAGPNASTALRPHAAWSPM
jgi:hypothetical protein